MKLTLRGIKESIEYHARTGPLLEGKKYIPMTIGFYTNVCRASYRNDSFKEILEKIETTAGREDFLISVNDYRKELTNALMAKILDANNGVIPSERRIKEIIEGVSTPQKESKND